MKQYVCLFVIALVHQAACFPIGESLTSVVPEIPSLTPEIKGAPAQHADAPVPSAATSIVPEKVVENPTPPKEVASDALSSPAPVAAAPEKPVAKEASVQSVQDAAKNVAAVTVDAVKHAVENINQAVKEAVKPATEAKSEVQVPVEVPTSEGVKHVEPMAASSERPKEANSQVNSVSVDEPKPVPSEAVKSVIPQVEAAKEEVKVAEPVKAEKFREEVKIESVKDEVKSEKVVEEVKKLEEVKPDKEQVSKSEVVASGEAKREETPVSLVSSASSEESVKGDVSSEEKNTSGERGVVSGERKESEEKPVSTEAKRESAEGKEVMANLKPTEKAPAPTPEEAKKEEKMEEKKEEKPEEKKEEKKEMVKDEKKDLREESPAKPIAELVESAKPSTVAAVSPAAAAPAVTEKVDQERDVIKREAANHKHDEKKSTEIVKKDKLKSGSSVQKEDEIKSSQGQDRVVN